jgi:regulator of sigma E protease
VKTDTAPKKGLPVTEIVFTAAIIAAIYFGVLKGKDIGEALRSLLSIGLAVIGIGFIIFIHELGHFLAAKWCDVQVEKFAVGIGPLIPGLSFQRGETSYGIAWFPIGGYVKMLGQADPGDKDADAELARTSPRSYMNKPVGQRMLIISAGVVMNLIFGFLTFIIVYFFGKEEMVGRFGGVSPGSPAERAGLRAGSELLQVGSITNPWYNDLNMTSALARSNETQIKLVFKTPEGDVRDVTVVPKKDKYDQRPTIGIGQPLGRRLSRFGKKGKPLAEKWVPAGEAPFEPGDVVEAVKPASLSSFLPVKNGFEIQLIESRYRDEPLTYQVVRGDKSTESTPNTVEITVQPGYFVTLGLRMKIGPIVSLSDFRPECSKGVQVGDVITALNGDANFDPMRLPDQVHELVNAGKSATLQIQRDGKNFPLVVDPEALKGRGTWVEESPVNNTPMAFPALGFSYQVTNQIAGVTPGSPADKAGLKVGETIKHVKYVNEEEKLDESFDLGEQFAWPYAFSWMQMALPPSTQYILTVVDAQGNERTTAPLTPIVDKTWYRYSRGLPLEVETSIRVASNFWDAIEIGGRESYRFVGRIYLNLYSLIRGDLSPKLLAGPIKLAEMTYLIAHQGIIDLLHFLAIISINLAIVNFLPIPVLDGGHMVLLLAEKVRGRPLHETWVIVATYIGLSIVLLLMVSTIFIDITKFAWFQKLFNW